jgi:hypothetical protein
LSDCAVSVSRVRSCCSRRDCAFIFCLSVTCSYSNALRIFRPRRSAVLSRPPAIARRASAIRAMPPSIRGAPDRGDWEGIGDQASATGGFTFSARVQDRVIVRTTHSHTPATADKPASWHDDFMVIHVDVGHVKARTRFSRLMATRSRSQSRAPARSLERPVRAMAEAESLIGSGKDSTSDCQTSMRRGRDPHRHCRAH